MTESLPTTPRRTLTTLLALATALSLVFAADAAAAPAPPQFVGLQSWGEPTAQDHGRLAKAGVTEFRTVLSWRSVEPNRPRCYGKESCHSYRWGRYDDVFELAARRGVRILPVLMGTPSWAASDQHYPPKDTLSRGSYYDFAAAVTRRYGTRGTFWAERNTATPAHVKAQYLQIWNEPNLGNYWNGKPNAGAYANLLRGASKAAKAANPATRIVAGGLPWSSGPRPEDFLKGMYAWNGGALKSYVDAVAVHPYARTPSTMAGQVRSTRLTLNGLRVSRPIWVTEIGWATGRPDGRFQVSESQQAAYLKDGLERLIAARNSWNVDRVYWFSLSDDPRRGWYYKTGLYRTNGSAKPSWNALLRVTGKR